MSKHPEQPEPQDVNVAYNQQQRRYSDTTDGALKRGFDEVLDDRHQRATSKGIKLPSLSDLALGAGQWAASSRSKRPTLGSAALLPSFAGTRRQSSSQHTAAQFPTRSASDSKNMYAVNANHASSAISRMVRNDPVADYEENDAGPSKRRRSPTSYYEDHPMDSSSARTAHDTTPAVLHSGTPSVLERSGWSYGSSESYDWRGNSSRQTLRTSPSINQMKRKFSQGDMSKSSEGNRSTLASGLPSTSSSFSRILAMGSPPLGTFPDESRRIPSRYSDVRTTSAINSSSTSGSRRASPGTSQPFSRYEPLSLGGCPGQRHPSQTSPVLIQSHRSSNEANQSYQQPLRAFSGHSSEAQQQLSPSTSRDGSDLAYHRHSSDYREERQYSSSSKSSATSPASLASPRVDCDSFLVNRSDSIDSGIVSRMSGLAHDEAERRGYHAHEAVTDTLAYHHRRMHTSTEPSSTALGSWPPLTMLPLASTSYYHTSGAAPQSTLHSQTSPNFGPTSATPMPPLSSPTALVLSTGHAEVESDHNQMYKNSSSSGSHHSTNTSPQANQTDPDSDGGPRRGNFPRPVTEYLRQWLFNHRDHPYPSDQEKREMTQITKLDLRQLNNWFINARRRVLRHGDAQREQLSGHQGAVAAAEESLD
ncbi:unnamed protein product [Tilletia controversa]|uniref:Homeobox domain-containing protein n=3 Tax=Tilletia TaxID=13289 RepID=A0A8X7MWN2_9BASI|nr:hypothetical protein CF336_g351 [Tilletia laevis]KAE8203063.1 hypothetical protein CF328_g1849 [Tilletia controversa]KAE8263955.1 hypothetical protein A4X03_0g1304 [Tilletia caries]KAE8207531.1 hypothetical protein CF335_g1074 [Tilletia laevis]KAE8252246.1 hypothetical protein A4X06_0g2323 [Tilletia controversa]